MRFSRHVSPGATPGGFRALVLEGDPGIGKTALWQAGVSMARARSHHVLACAPGEAESQLPLCAFADLVADVDLAALDALDGPQRDALAVAAGRSASAAPQALAVSRAFVSMLRCLAATRPVLVAVDDAQWLDRSSAAIIEFAARRLGDEQVGLLLARRTDGNDRLEVEQAVDASRVEHLMVGPLEHAAVSRLVHDNLGLDVSLPTLERLMQVSAGNPFFALELARTLPDGDDAGGALSIPKTLRDVVAGRLDALDDDALEVCLVVSASTRPTPATVIDAVGDRSRVDRGLGEAEAAGVIRVDGLRLRFTHPLLGSAVYTGASATERRLLHRRLSEVIADPEERALHLALGADGPDESVAAAVQDAAWSAAARGAPSGAADLLDRACQLTPETDPVTARRRKLDAARFHFDSGATSTARRLLDEVIAAADPGPERGRALKQLASVLRSTDGVDAATRMYERALIDAEGDPALQASIHEALAWMRCFTGSVPGTYVHATKALELLDGVEDDLLRMAVVAAVAEAEFHMGMPVAHTTIEAALRLAEAHPDAVSAIDSPLATRASHLVRMDDLDGAEAMFEQCLARAAAVGDEASRSQLLLYAAIIRYERGDLVAARARLREADEAARQAGQLAVNWSARQYDALLDAYEGNLDAARKSASDGLVVAREQECHQWRTIRLQHVLGFIELSAGDLEAANRWLAEAYEANLRSGVREPGSFSHLVPDHVEVLIGVGRLEEARGIIDDYEAQGRAVGRRRTLAAVARLRGLLLAAGDNLEGAVESLSHAVESSRALPYPFDLGRSLLVQGMVHRRAKHKKLARESLTEAITVLVGFGATPWADRARAELARVGGRSPGSLDLTSTEEQVAKLVAEGLTNKEVADRLFLSVRSVESNLTKVYRKLNVRSRTELAQLASR